MINRIEICLSKRFSCGCWRWKSWQGYRSARLIFSVWAMITFWACSRAFFSSCAFFFRHSSAVCPFHLQKVHFSEFFCLVQVFASCPFSSQLWHISRYRASLIKNSWATSRWYLPVSAHPLTVGTFEWLKRNPVDFNHIALAESCSLRVSDFGNRVRPPQRSIVTTFPLVLSPLFDRAQTDALLSRISHIAKPRRAS